MFTSHILWRLILLLQVTSCLVLLQHTASADASTFSLNLLSDALVDSEYGMREAYGISSCKSYSTAAGLGQPGCASPLQLLTLLAQDAALQPSQCTLFAGGALRPDLPTKYMSVEEALLPASLALGMLNPTHASLSDENYTSMLFSAVGPTDIPKFNISQTSHPNIDDVRKVLELRSLLPSSEATVFSKCGYYSSNASSTLRIVVLNTVVYSSSLNPAVNEEDGDPCGQFAFLEQELKDAAAASMKVIILANVPPTVNVTAIMERGSFSTEAEDSLWVPRFQAHYISLVSTYSSTVALQVFGNTHHFSIIADPTVGSAMLTVASVSPLDGNTPSYMVADMDAFSFTMTALRQRRLEDKYHVSDVDVLSPLGLNTVWGDLSAMQQTLRSLLTNDERYHFYRDVVTGGRNTSGASKPILSCQTNFCRRVTSCSQLYTSYSAVVDCSKL